jgi:hypothetical protein
MDGLRWLLVPLLAQTADILPPLLDLFLCWSWW